MEIWKQNYVKIIHEIFSICFCFIATDMIRMAWMMEKKKLHKIFLGVQKFQTLCSIFACYLLRESNLRHLFNSVVQNFIRRNDLKKFYFSSRNIEYTVTESKQFLRLLINQLSWQSKDHFHSSTSGCTYLSNVLNFGHVSM